ncbi:MAG: hypothetical protein ACRD07_09520 [Acidimicrobiales bacterium]
MTAIEDRLRDLRRSVSPPHLPTADEVAQRGRYRRRRRRAVAVLGVLTVLALVPLVVVRLSGDGDEERVVSGGPRDALATVRAAVGRTFAAGSYEIDVATTMTQPGTSSCSVLISPESSQTESTWCEASGALTNQFTGHAIVNLEPYAMVAETNSPSLGAITTHVNSTHVWQLGGAGVGYGPGTPGLSLADYSSLVVGTLGRGPGALAMISIASRGGYLYLEEEAVASAEPAGTGTVGDVPVTYYDISIDVTRLADAPNLSDIQRQTIAAALPLLEESGYTGTTERIGVDDMGYVREVNTTTNFDDGSSTEGHSILSNFGCAPKVYMPNETPPPDTTPPPCPTATTASPSTATTASPSTATTASPSTTTAPSDDAAASCGTCPYFRPSPGWEAVQGGSAATAANISLGPNTLSGDAPWDTVERLEEGDVVLYAMFWPAGKADLPSRELPLSLDDAEPGGLEGQPDDVYADRLGAQVDGWNIDLLVFYGGGDPTGVPAVPSEPSAETRVAAREQLARLEVPPHGDRTAFEPAQPRS